MEIVVPFLSVRSLVISSSHTPNNPVVFPLNSSGAETTTVISFFTSTLTETPEEKMAATEMLSGRVREASVKNM
jgi:hypothetical protein